MCDRCGVDHAEFISANPEDVPEFLRKLLGGGRTDPDTEAQVEMDRAVAIMLDAYRQRVDSLTERPSDDPAVMRTLTTPTGASAIAKNMAGEFMFQNEPAAIAYAASLLAARYSRLLDQWAELYVALAKDPTLMLEFNLNAAQTPEAKDAATRAAGPDEPEPTEVRTGQYL
jgi:hypothetical protein